ncbi:DNA-directed RNA polymerase subunit P [archaeon]|nr:DNA-directed RNA polymerase subunit P [archaeon]MBT4351999.1 DNA-directed RNA polymerase subunit P [archaeon]MBT4646805.1 DNA-directed RNA polymerase subunit P [archaeon]MBT6821481.1 DNA-directed RNA polymerase subunit P [archaeon]MBT7392963.1 DNA-directed RNA polymerase subunit P [archaeon]
MTIYKCFNCNKDIERTTLRKRVRCPYCGYKILFKPRLVPSTKVIAR